MRMLDALSCTNKSGRPPVWLMRQAGRYMYEYQALRKKYDFLTLCHTPELICEVTHLPINAFGFDAAILFSDILLITQALGFDLSFEDEVGPVIGNPLKQGARLEYREVVLHNVLEGIKLLKKSLNVPLIGFAGAPFTVASYLIEGKSSKDLSKTKKWLEEDPKSFEKLLDVLADCTIEYLNRQIEAGCDALQLFDSWAIYLGPEEFDRFCVKPIEKIVKGLKKCPVILFSRGDATRFAKISPQAISCDWTCDLEKARNAMPEIALQGNLDPDILLRDSKTVIQETKALLDKMKGDPGYIFNLGHGVHKSTPRENVEALVDTVKSYG